MTLTLDIPDALAATLGAALSDVRRAIVEGFAVDAYRSGRISTLEVRTLLGHTSRWQTENFLAERGAWPAPTESESEADLHNLSSLRVS